MATSLKLAPQLVKVGSLVTKFLAIPKTTNSKHLKENIAVSHFNLSDEEIEVIEDEEFGKPPSPFLW